MTQPRHTVPFLVALLFPLAVATGCDQFGPKGVHAPTPAATPAAEAPAAAPAMASQTPPAAPASPAPASPAPATTEPAPAAAAPAMAPMPAATPTPAAPTPAATPAAAAAVPADDMLDAVLWMQHSVEYEGATTTAFELARLRLDQALKDKKWTALPADQKGNLAKLPLAVI